MHFDRMIVSDLPRTIETVALVLTKTGRQIELEHGNEREELRGNLLRNHIHHCIGRLRTDKSWRLDLPVTRS
jgi:broad specificity phosphatase PhoE